MGRKSVTGPRPPSGAGATSGKGKKGVLRAGVHSLLSTFGGAILAAFVGYAIGYFTQNDKTSPGETVRRLLRSVAGLIINLGADCMCERTDECPLYTPQMNTHTHAAP